MSRVGLDAGAGVAALDVAEVERAFVVFAVLVADHAELLDRLNAFPVPDADTGRNLSATLRSALEALAQPGGPNGGDGSLATVCATLADGAFMGARGNSGTILAQLLGGFLEVVGRAERLDATTLVTALRRAAEVGPLAVAEVAAGTMLTVAADVGRAVGAVVDTSPVERPVGPPAGIVDVLEAAWSAGQEALARTIEDNPVLARAGVVDAGAAGYLLLFDALLHVADGRPLPRPDPSLAQRTGNAAADDEADRAADNGVGGPAFEVMFSLEAPVQEKWPAAMTEISGDGSGARRTVIAALGTVGDSVVVTGRPGCWTCHIHTDDIGAALEAVLHLGRPRRVRVEMLHPPL